MTTKKFDREIIWNEFLAALRLTDNESFLIEKKEFEKLETSYRMPDVEDLEVYLGDVLERLSVGKTKRNKQENLQAFEQGWDENLQKLITTKDPAFLIPGYFRNSDFLRYNKQLILPKNKNLEYDLFKLTRNILFREFAKDYSRIYEVGCGSYQNLFALSELFKDKRLVGMDWTSSSVQIADILRTEFNIDIEGHVFDMLNPHSGKVNIEPGHLVVTIHAMEQLGPNHTDFLNYLLSCKPGLVLQLEPIQEFYDPQIFYDSLALYYCGQRGYLTGYLTALRDLEQKGALEIKNAFRPCIGGVYHEASVIIWSPSPN